LVGGTGGAVLLGGNGERGDTLEICPWGSGAVSAAGADRVGEQCRCPGYHHCKLSRKMRSGAKTGIRPMTLSPKVIDISHYDDIASFEGLAAAGLLGVIQKATEGATDVDPTYADRVAPAQNAKLLWAAYHFWRSEDSAEAQAANFLAVAKDAPRWALDYEVSGGTPAAIVAIMNLIKAGASGKMMLYGPKDIIEELITAATDEEKAFLAQADLWWAEYSVAAPTPSRAVQAVWPTIFLWQYTESGTISGAEGEVDLNCCSVTDEDLATHWSAAA